MNQEISAGYGSAEDLTAPAGAELANQEAPAEEGAGGDMEAMIAEGVQAFVESQDPQIAVEVVNMLAEAMGLAGGAVAPAPEGGAPAPAPVPTAKHGGKFGFFGDQNQADEFLKFVSNK